jgi:hypothetical protein
MRFEILIQFIVPLMFLAIWALTSLLNRDAQPLPPRPGRQPGAGGPRPLGQAPGRPDLRSLGPGTPTPARTATRMEERSIWPQTPSTAATARERNVPRPPLKSVDEAIVYLENDPIKRNNSRQPSTSSPAAGVFQGPRSPRAAQQRKVSRGRSITSNNATGQGREEPKTRRALSDQVNQSMALQRNKPLEIAPLVTPLAPLSLPLSQASVAPQSRQERGLGSSATPSVSDIRTMLSSPGKLREFALFTEILQPPVSLRRRGDRSSSQPRPAR